MRTTVTARTRDDGRPLEEQPFVHDFTSQDGLLRFTVDRGDLDATMGRLTELGIDELTVTPASLEDMFLREYQGEPR